MKILVRSIALLLFVCGAGRAHDVAQHMAGAAEKFIATLTPELRAKGTFDFSSDERTHWEFVPKIRSGVTLKELNATQRLAAFGLLASGLSPEGMGKATNLISLELVLREIEKGKGSVRDPELYYFSIYGHPGGKDPWSWRVEGHHLSLNFTIVGGTVSATPEFFGSNPAEVRDGPRKGLRVLADEEDGGYAMLNALDDERRSVAIWTDKAPGDIVTGNKRKVTALEAVGLPAEKMTAGQKAKLVELVTVYCNRHRAELAADDLAKIEKAGWNNVHFGWAGGTERGMVHYYRVQGPTFLLELDNRENGNHVHTVWRDFASDFADDLLAEHYRKTPH